MFCVSDERDNGHSPVYRAVMILLLLYVLMRLMFFAFRRKSVRHSLSCRERVSCFEISFFSTRNNVHIGPRGNVLARKRILTYLQPFIKVDLHYYYLTSKDLQHARRFSS
jgi:hypothetical protein